MAMNFDVTDMYMSAKTPEQAAQRVGFFTGIRLTIEENQNYTIHSETEITQLQRECNALAVSHDEARKECDDARKECDELKIQLAILKINHDSLMASSPSLRFIFTTLTNFHILYFLVNLVAIHFSNN